MTIVPGKLAVAFDTNALRSRDLVPFLVQHKARFRILVPAVIYMERLYSFLLKGDDGSTYKEEMSAYDGHVVNVSPEHLHATATIAFACRRSLPFRDHARDYMIAGQCQGNVDVLVTYNKKHFEAMHLSGTTLLTPEEFITRFHASR